MWTLRKYSRGTQERIPGWEGIPEVEKNVSSREYKMGNVKKKFRSQEVARFGICIFGSIGRGGLRELL